MTSTLTRRNGRAAEPEGAPRRIERRVGLPSSRAVVGGLLMALAPGETIAADDVELVPVEVPGHVRGLFGAVDAAVGRQVAAPVEAGAFLLASATVEPVEGEEVLEVALSLPASRAVGRLRPGERVDVFSTWGSDVTELVAVDARVLEVGGGSSRGLGGAEAVVVRLAVRDFAQLEALVHAQAAGDITLVRAAIGSAVEDVGREYRPGVPRDDDTDDGEGADR